MVAHGIRRFKGATLPELEIALQAGATDLLLAMPSAAIAGRLLDLAAANPSARFHAVVDDMQTLHRLEALTRKRNQTPRFGSISMLACTARALPQARKRLP